MAFGKASNEPYVLLDVRVFLNSPSFAINSLKLSFKLFLLTKVISNYCEGRKIKLLNSVYMKISVNLCNFLHFEQFFSNFLEFQ